MKRYWPPTLLLALALTAMIGILLSETVPVTGANTPSVYLPLVASNYCEAPFVDDFSDPNSGWFVGSTDAATYAYINGEYSMYHKLDRWWVGVASGFTWDGVALAQVEGRIVNGQEGILGMIFGWRDWDHFYTFEIWPNEQYWVVLQYDNGWQLLREGTTGAIRTGAATNTLTIKESNGLMQLLINNSAVYSLNERNGQLGMSSYTFNGGVDVRYDNFTIATPGCALTTNLTESMTGPTTFAEPATFPYRER